MTQILEELASGADRCPLRAARGAADLRERSMLKSVLAAAAAVAMLGVVACSPATTQDTAATTSDQSTAGQTDMAQGAADQNATPPAGDQSTAQTPPASGAQTTTPPATTP